MDRYIKQGIGSHINRGLKVKVKSCPTLRDPMDCSLQASPSMGFSRQEYWSGLSFPSPGDLPDPGIKPRSQGPNPGLPPCRQTLYPLSYLEASKFQNLQVACRTASGVVLVQKAASLRSKMHQCFSSSVKYLGKTNVPAQSSQTRAVPYYSVLLFYTILLIFN